VSSGIDATLVERVRRGDYVVDADAVAEAMMRRWRDQAHTHAFGSAERAGTSSAMLVALQPLDGPAVETDHDEPAPGANLA
jgi:hypothetical protein